MKCFTNYVAFHLLFISVFVIEAAAKVIYAAPDGTATNTGTRASPWSLQKALSKTAAKAGDVRYFAGQT